MTTRRLLLLRHGKSGWANSTTSDFDRSLDARGIRDSLTIGAYLNSHIKLIDLVQCSSASRTRETLDNLLTMGIKVDKIVFDDRLYVADESEILDLISASDPEIKTLLIIGHNPWIQKIAYDLSPDETSREIIRSGFPTCGLFQAQLLGTSWDFKTNKITKTEMITPKVLLKGIQNIQ